MSDTAHSQLTSSKEELHFAKIVATPTDTAWSQAYNAGKLFAVLSITNESEEEEKLNIHGKEILNTLEEEFYTLEEKNFESIQQAAKTTIQKFSPPLTTSLAIATIKENVLYVFLIGNGTILLKRDGKLGILLEKETELTGASGHLQNGDTLILATEQFLETIPLDTLEKTIENNPPHEIAETLSPKIHEKEDGGASAIIISYEKQVQDDEVVSPVETEELVEEEMDTEPEPTHPSPKPRIALPSFSFRVPQLNIRTLLPQFFSQVTHSRKMFLSVSALLVLILALSIFFSIAKRNDAKTKEKFDTVYNEVQKHYDEGTALLGLNKNLAREDLQKALSLSKKELPQFKKGSPEYTKLLELQQKIESDLGPITGTTSVATKEVNKTESPSLAILIDHTEALFVTKNDDSFFFVDSKSMNQVDSKNQSKKLFDKGDLWKTPAGIATYGSNLYLLDKDSSQVLKFPGATTPPSNYFTDSPKLSNPTSIAIDSAVYVLLSDGTVAKFVKGKQEQFTITGLDGTLQNPTRIWTNEDANNLYILDKANARVVILSKSGVYGAQYKADVIKNAQDFDVREKDKKIFVLSGGKIYQIDIQ